MAVRMLGIKIDGTEGAMTLMPAGDIQNITRKSPTVGTTSTISMNILLRKRHTHKHMSASQESSKAPPLPLDPVPDGNQVPQHA
jgi:hypothetical protein